MIPDTGPCTRVIWHKWGLYCITDVRAWFFDIFSRIESNESTIESKVNKQNHLSCSKFKQTEWYFQRSHNQNYSNFNKGDE